MSAYNVRIDFWLVSADTPGLAVCFSGLPGTVVGMAMGLVVVLITKGLLVVEVVVVGGGRVVVVVLVVVGAGVVVVVVVVGLVVVVMVVNIVDDGIVYCGLCWGIGLGLVMNVWWLPILELQLGLKM